MAWQGSGTLLAGWVVVLGHKRIAGLLESIMTKQSRRRRSGVRRVGFGGELIVMGQDHLQKNKERREEAAEITGHKVMQKLLQLSKWYMCNDTISVGFFSSFRSTASL